MPTKIPNRFRSLVIEVVALVILVPLSVFLFTKLSNHQQREISNVFKSPATPSATPLPTASAETTPSATPSQQPINSSIALKISSPEKSYTYKVSTKKSLSVIEIMKIAESQGMSMKTKDYGAPLGLLIEEINNIKNDQKNQKYWTLYINGKMSVLGASSAVVSPNESITWKFENTTL